MVLRTELSVTSNRDAVHPTSYSPGDRSKWLKVAMFAPIVIVGVGLLIYALMRNPSPPPPGDTCVNSVKIDPNLGPESEYCQEVRTLWDETKHSIIQCKHSRGAIGGYICLDSLIAKSVVQCNMTTEVAAQIYTNKQFAQPMPPVKLPNYEDELSSEENAWICKRRLNSLGGYLRNPNCESSNCCDLERAEIDPREDEAITAINSNRFFTPPFEEDQEYLRLRADDPREKTLFLSTVHSMTGRPLAPKEYTKELQDLNEKTDLKFKVVSDYHEICHEIRKASQIGKINRIYIQAEQEILKSFSKMIGSEIKKEGRLFSECFSSPNYKDMWIYYTA